jgi:hypothetical protein
VQVVRNVCCAAHDGFLVTPHGDSVAVGCAESPQQPSTLCAVHTSLAAANPSSVVRGKTKGPERYPVSDFAISGTVLKKQDLKRNGESSESDASSSSDSDEETDRVTRSNSNHWVVESIILHKIVPAANGLPRQVSYYVKWKNFPMRAASWCAEVDIRCDALLDTYWNDYPSRMRVSRNRTADVIAIEEEIMQHFQVLRASDQKRAAELEGGSCNTLKEANVEERVFHSTGVFVLLYHCGAPIDFEQLMRAESCTQVSMVLARHVENVAGFPVSDRSIVYSSEQIVLMKKRVQQTIFLYDDACHLHAFMHNPLRADATLLAILLTGVLLYVDLFHHITNHVGKRCLEQHRMPDELIAAVNSETCEQFFKRFNMLKRTFRNMSRDFSELFLVFYFELYAKEHWRRNRLFDD